MTHYEKLIMEKEEIFDRISEIIKEKTEVFNREITELESEQLRIQGEYRLLVELNNKSKEEEVVTEEIEDADKIIEEIVTTEDK